MTSGVSVGDAAKRAIECIKVHHAKDDPRSRYKFLFFTIDAVAGEINLDKSVQIKEVDGEDQDAHQILRTHLQEYVACYAIWDCCFETDLTEKSELVSIMWIAENAPVKQRLLYASSKESMKKALSACGIKHEWEVTDASDIIDRRSLCSKLSKEVIKLEGKAI